MTTDWSDDGPLERLYAPPEIGAPGRRRARAQRRDLLFAGGFVVAMALLAGALAAWLNPGLFGRSERFSAYFAEAQGLEVGVPVMQTGYVIGLVERVAPVFPDRDEDAEHCPPGRPPCFRATLRIRQGWPIPADSLVQPGSRGILKGDAILLLPGESGRRLADGERLGAVPPGPDLAAQLGRLTDTLTVLVDQRLNPILESVQRQVASLEALLGSAAGSEEQGAHLGGALEHLRGLSANLEQAVDPEAIAAILASVREMSAHLARITAEMTQSTAQAQQAVVEYGALATDVRALIGANRPALERSLDETQYLMQSLSAALTPILTHLEDASRDLAALARELRGDPSLVIKRRAQPEQAPWFRNE